MYSQSEHFSGPTCAVTSSTVASRKIKILRGLLVIRGTLTGAGTISICTANISHYLFTVRVLGRRGVREGIGAKGNYLLAF